MTSALVSLSLVTLLVAVAAAAEPVRDRDWKRLALIGILLGVGYGLAYQLVLGREIASPIRWIEGLTGAIIGLFR